ncbi:MAG: hypothetical protein DRH76_04265 [Deltaproteobacteria bacterium]|nr:MAG: hypothetical protein DRH76_04265 [Deltaproteobacteria bacterium]
MAVALVRRPQGLIPPVEGSRFIAAIIIFRDRGQPEPTVPCGFVPGPGESSATAPLFFARTAPAARAT